MGLALFAAGLLALAALAVLLRVYTGTVQTLTKVDGTIYQNTTQTYTAGGDGGISTTIAHATTNAPIASFGLVLAKSLLFVAVSTVNLTIKVNSSTAPTKTLTLVAGLPVIWRNDTDLLANHPLGTTDVTSGLFVTNADAVNDASLTIISLYTAP